jgi:hypothetical protein
LLHHFLFGVDGEGVGDFDDSGVTVADARRGALCEDVFGKVLFSFRTVARRAACAPFDRSIADDPDGLLISFWAGWLEPQSGSVGTTRHNSLIRSIAARVVKSLPAIRSISKRPRRASTRSDFTVMEPSGNARAAAVFSRNGVDGVMWGGGLIIATGRRLLADDTGDENPMD